MMGQQSEPRSTQLSLPNGNKRWLIIRHLSQLPGPSFPWALLLKLLWQAWRVWRYLFITGWCSLHLHKCFSLPRWWKEIWMCYPLWKTFCIIGFVCQRRRELLIEGGKVRQKNKFALFWQLWSKTAKKKAPFNSPHMNYCEHKTTAADLSPF